MHKFLAEIKHDLSFIKSHTLQPKWFKVLKVFLLLGFLGSYVFLFGWGKTIVFSIIFFGLMLIVHFVYRAKTKRFSQTWLDFIVCEEEGGEEIQANWGILLWGNHRECSAWICPQPGILKLGKHGKKRDKKLPPNGQREFLFYEYRRIISAY